jgi:RHS repeat-associated protein
MKLAKDASSAAQPLISDIQWEPFGGVRSWQMQMTSGTKLQERVSDQYGRLVRYPLGSVVRDITYDAADRIVSYTHLDATTGEATAAAQAMNQSFGYDELGRLTSIVTPANSWAIGYDANGNRTSVTQNGAVRAYTTAVTSNRLNSVSNPTRNLGYDAAGNTLTDTGSGHTTTYRLDNRMGTLTKNGVTLTYRYDAAGQRVHKEHSQGMRYFAYDQGGKMLGEYNATTQVHEFVWLGDTPVAVMTGSGPEPSILHVYADHLNAPRMLIDKADALRWRWMSEPFGTATPEQAPAGLAQVVFNLRFPGQFFDIESGLYYNYFRDYDPTLGRYVQSDPIGMSGGTNTFVYVGSNPIRNIDPMGLMSCRFTGVFIICENFSPRSVDRDLPPVSTQTSAFPSYSSSSSSSSNLNNYSCPVVDKAWRKVNQVAQTMPPPGDCSPWEKDRLQNEVNMACKRPRACNPSMDQMELILRANNNRQCANARDQINRLCYRGGDVNHRNAAIDAWGSLAKCDELR